MKKIIITINPIKLLKRYLKENNIYATYRKYTRGNEISKIQPENYFARTNINDKVFKINETTDWRFDLSKYKIYDLFNKHNKNWQLFLKYEINKNECIDKFIMFLKKRNLYNLYQSCFAPYYVNKLKSKNISCKISPYKTITQWQDLYPQEFINSAFDKTHTIKTEEFWITLNEKWIKELNETQIKIKYVYE